MAEKSLSPEIIKLMDKITKDPTSRLFVPLAEEYVKCDMLDEAILVLGDGIKNHPTYLAGRVLLGKVFLQKKQIPEAKAEFEQAIQINPDNVLAHKKLATIYQGEGQLQMAIDACKKILTIDPSDKETKGLLSTLEKAAALARIPESRVDQIQEAMAPPSDSFSAAPEQTEEILPTLDTSLPKSVPGDLSPSASGPIIEEAIEVVEVKERESPIPPVPGIEEGPSPAPEILTEAVSPVDHLPEPLAEVSDQKVQEQPDSITAEPGEELLSGTLASLYVSQGYYEKAILIYKKLLAQHPSDEESRQGLEEATQKLEAMKQKESASSASGAQESQLKTRKTQQLQAWLDSIRKNEPS